jgi:palmitoyl-[glycerolipid] 3-(E)-desaturase
MIDGGKSNGREQQQQQASGGVGGRNGDDQVRCDIDRLNGIVKTKTAAFIADSIATGVPVSAEVAAVRDGTVSVYKKRWTLIPPVVGITSILVIAYSAITSGAWTAAIAMVFMFFWYDFFSGVLHITLDNSDFINLPLLGPPCLEFQWHHHIPLDLASKSFFEVLGDLNVVIIGLIGVYLLPYGFSYKTPMALCLVSSKVLCAYFGQMCHRMAHMPHSKRPQWAQYLQQAGVMLPPKQHSIHHIHYDDNFCIGK